MVITMAHQRSGWSITNNGEMTVLTPFDGYRMSKLSWNHENSADTWKCHHEIDVSSRQFTVDVDVSRRVMGAVRRLSAKIAFQTPANVATWLQNLNAVIDYQYDMRAWKSSGVTNFRWGRYAFGHEHEVNIEPYTTFVTTAKLTTPFSGFEELGIGLNNSRHGNQWRANNEVLMGRTGKVTLDGSLNYNGYNYNGMIRITTPIRRIESIVVNVRNAQQHDGVWASHADVQYAPGKTMSVDSKIGLGSQKMIELEAATPFSFLRQMKYKAGYSGTWRNFRASTELQHNMLGRITAMTTLDANILRRMNGQLMIRTPFEEFSLLRVTARHTRESHEHMVTTASWQLNRYQGSLLHDVTARSWTDFDSRSELEYLSNRKIELDLSFHLDPKIIVMATLTSPCEHARRISFSFSQEGSLDNFRNNFTASYNRREITGSSEYNADGSRMKFELRTPWRAFRSYNFQHANKPGDSFVGWRNSWSAESNGQRQSGGSECDWNGNRLDAHVTWNIPEEYSIRISHTVNSVNHFSNNIIIKLAGDQITEALQFRRTTDKIDLRLNLASSFSGYERMQAVFGHELSDGGFTTTLSISTPFVGYDRFHANLVFNGELQHFTASSTVRLPFDGYERFSAELSHNGGISNFSTNLEIRTPFSDYSTFAVGIKHEHQDGLKTSISVQTPVQGYENLRLSLLKTGDVKHMQLQAELTTSIRQLERTALNWSHNINRRAIQLNGLLETSIPGYSKFGTSCEFSSSRRNWKWSASAETPFRGYDRWTASIEHTKDASGNGFRTVVQATTPINNYNNFAATLSHSGELSQFTSQLRVNVPFRELQQIDVTLTHRGASPRDFATSLSVEYARKKMELEMAFKMGPVRQTEMNYEGSFRLVAPCPYVRDFSITASHNRKPEINTGALKITFNGEEKVCTVIKLINNYNA